MVPKEHMRNPERARLSHEQVQLSPTTQSATILGWSIITEQAQVSSLEKPLEDSQGIPANTLPMASYENNAILDHAAPSEPPWRSHVRDPRQDQKKSCSAEFSPECQPT